MKNSLGVFLHNISWLFKKKLKKEVVDRDLIEKIVDFEITNKCGDLIYSNIRNSSETIALLSSSNKSIARFGDGECTLIQGDDIPFQKTSQELINRLVEVLTSNQENMVIAVPKLYFSNVDSVDVLTRNFILQHGKRLRDIFKKYLESRCLYYDAGFTVPPANYGIEEKEEYFNYIQTIWEKKEICIVCGRTVFNNIEYNIFDNARSIEYIYCLSKDAFSEYDLIINRVRKVSKNKLLIIILGPTATILSYDLCKEGYRCLDIGHIAKSYDWFKKNKNIYAEGNIVEFFDPD